MAFIKALCLLLIIPVVGMGVAHWVLSDLNNSLVSQEMPTVDVLCSSSTLSQASGVMSGAEFNQLTAMCNDIEPIC